MPEPGGRDGGLPPPPLPQGKYLPVVVHGGVAYSAGMTPRVRGELVARGLVGREILPEQAREMAGIAARNAMAAIGAAIGGTDRIVRCLQLTVYVAAAPGFTEYSSVADGASTALLTALGDGGTAARTAVGVAGLPAGAPVEVALTAAVHLPQNRAG